MTGCSVSRLANSLRPYRLSQLSDQFESVEFATEEDRKRAASLRNASRMFDLSGAEDLARLLDPDLSPQVPRTCASSRYMRRQRTRIIGSLLPVVEPDQATLKLFCVVNPRWAVPLTDLHTVSGKAVMTTLRQQLLRLGSSRADGYLFAAYHCEFNETDELFYGHVHGFSVGGMSAVVDKLRTRKCYRSSRSTGVDGAVVDPVWLTRRKITNLPHALSYVLKSYWPRYVEGPTGKRATRLREPHHSHALLWMDRHSLEDLTLLVKLKVGSRGIRPTKRTSMI